MSLRETLILLVSTLTGRADKFGLDVMSDEQLENVRGNIVAVVDPNVIFSDPEPV